MFELSINLSFFLKKKLVWKDEIEQYYVFSGFNKNFKVIKDIDEYVKN